MPIVFIHGVNNRRDAEYERSEKLRDWYFRQALTGVVADASKATILNPYWGEFGASMAWDNACLPLEQNEQFGGEAEEVFKVLLAEVAPDVIAPPNQILLTLARKSLVRAVDGLWAAAGRVEPDPGHDDADTMTKLAWKALAYARANPRPPWLAEVRDDGGFVDNLLAEVENWEPPRDEPVAPAARQVEAFGVMTLLNRFTQAAARLGEAARESVQGGTKVVVDAAKDLGDAAAGAVINPVVRSARPAAHRRVSLFLGDVFKYLSERTVRDSNGREVEGPIVRKVAGDIEKADAARKPGVDEKLIVVAHSMGGIIAYDILTSFRPRIACDLLVTVGSQVGMFEELKLFRVSNPALKLGTTVPLPPNIKRWLNVFDTADVLGYSTARIFNQSQDFEFSTRVTALTAHSMYFDRPEFFERLRMRILKP